MVRFLEVPAIGRSSIGRGEAEEQSSGSPSPPRARGPYREELRLESIRSNLCESRLAILQGYYKISHNFSAFVPHSNEMIDRSPPSNIAIYKEYLKASLRFPFHQFFIQLFNLYHIVPVQLITNSIRIICLSCNLS